MRRRHRIPGRLNLGLALAAAVALMLPALGGAARTIVGGSAVSAKVAPWAVFVSIGLLSSADRCSGVIIDASHVLVAGHCVYHNDRLAPVSQISVRAGVTNLNTPTSPNEQDRSVSSYRVHPGFRHTGLDVPDDIAVLTLSTPLDLETPYVQATSLPAAGAPFPAGTEVVIAGFGRTVETGTTMGPLKEMTAIVERQGACGPYNDQSFYLDANAVFICAYTPIAAGCGGDSGDGFVTTGHRVVLGVLEDATPGCAPRSMEIGAYVGAPEILNFIQGDNRPPYAPRLTSRAAVGLSAPSPLDVGNMLRCSASGWKAPVRISYSYLDVSTGHFLATNTGPAFAVPSAAVGSAILCQAAITNTGGTLVANSLPTTTVQPAS